MFKRLRIKIIVAIMSILLVVFAGTLVVIYFASYSDVTQQNLDMMKQYAADYEKTEDNSDEDDTGAGNKTEQKNGGGNHENRDEIYGLTTFYTVELSQDGTVTDIVNEDSSGISDDELSELALEISERGKDSGSEDHMLYYIFQTEQGELIVFMNNVVTSDSFSTLFRYALIFGCCTMVILFFFSYFLSGRMLKPLEEAFRKQKQFISDASHELKTPLSVMSANADMLSREVGENKWLDNIRYENESMSMLVNQLLQLARAESSKPNLCEYNLSKTVTGYILPFESVAYEHGIKLEFDISDGIMAYGNAEQLGQVTRILVDNAICHTADSGTVKVELKRIHTTAVIKVMNTGQEIPPDMREKIFERFYRLDEARGREDDHYGLGLAIAKTIITEYKGRVSVDCTDGWTVFTVTLPLRLR